MRKPAGSPKVLLALALMLAGAFAARGWATRPADPRKPFSYAPGQAWGIEETILISVPDPQTGQILTPSTRGIFRYEVKKSFPDDSVLVSCRVKEFKGGPAPAQLKDVAVNPPPQVERLMLMTAEGEVYGPYVEPQDKQALETINGSSAWLSRKPRPRSWFWHKVPVEPLREGQSGRRALGGETWTITRLPDEPLEGVPCEVYSATLEGGDVEVKELTWYAPARGYALKREVFEKRARDVHAKLTQLRQT